MALDPNIILQGQGPQIANPLDLMSKAMTLKQLSRANQIQDQELADNDMLRQVYSRNLMNNPDGSTSVNQAGVMSDLTRGGFNPQKSMELGKQFRQQKQEDDEMNSKLLNQHLSRAKQLAWSIDGPESYQVARMTAIKEGLPNADKMPQQFDPNLVRSMQMATLTAEEQLGQKWKEKEYELKQQELGLKAREISNKKKEDEKNIPQNVYAAATYGQRLQDANRQMNELMNQGFDPTSISSGIASSKYFPERLMSGNSKLMEQAKRNFINAVLRRESGSAISDSEFASGDKQYFPVGGDTPDVLAQKERNRDVAIAGLMAEGEKAHGKLNKYLPQENIAAAPRPGSRGGDPLNPMAYADSASFTPDVLNYAKSHNLTPEAALAIKQQRGGK